MHCFTRNSRFIALLAIAVIAASACGPGDAEPYRDTTQPKVQDSTFGPTITVYKTAACGCCGDWVAQLRANSFRVVAIDTSAVGIDRLKRAHGVPASAASCHTAFVNGYIVEGHVPAADLRRLLRESPRLVGLAVPGMPVGSPGMEGPAMERYNVLALYSDGRSTVFARH